MKYEPISQYQMSKITVHAVYPVLINKRPVREQKREKSKHQKSKEFKDIYEHTIESSTYNHLKVHVIRKHIAGNMHALDVGSRQEIEKER